MIQIVRGVYGYLDKDGIVRPKTEADEPFELSPEQEARLVGIGVAQYVGKVKSAPVEEPQEVHSLADLSAKELREMAKDYGLTFKVGMSKAEMVAAIEAAESELDAADDSEPAPVFDASEAVQ